VFVRAARYFRNGYLHLVEWFILECLCLWILDHVVMRHARANEPLEYLIMTINPTTSFPLIDNEFHRALSRRKTIDRNNLPMRPIPWFELPHKGCTAKKFIAVLPMKHYKTYNWKNR